MRFVTRKIHAYLDYPVALSLIVLPFVLSLGASNTVAKWLAVATGIAALVLTLLTTHELGVLKVGRLWFHLNVERLVGVVCVAAPFVLGLNGLDAIYYWVNGIALLIVTVLLNAPQQEHVSTTA